MSVASPDPSRTSARQILGPMQIDQLGEAVIALTREVWILTDRLAVIEAVLAETGIDMAKVDRYQPDEAMAAKLDAKRKTLIGHIIAALGAGPEPG